MERPISCILGFFNVIYHKICSISRSVRAVTISPNQLVSSYAITYNLFLVIGDNFESFFLLFMI